MGGLSFHSSNFTDYSIEETVRILADLGYDAIELNLETAEPHFRAHVTPDISAERRRSIVRTIASGGLRLSSLSPHRDMIPPDERDRADAIQFVKNTIDLAADLGTDNIHIASGFLIDNVSEDVSWGWMVEAGQRLVEYGRRRGIKVGLEAGVFPGLIVWNTATMLELIDRVGYNDFYVNFDPSHYQSAGDNAVRTFQKLRERIVHVHAKDGRGTRQAFEFPPLGEGAVDWSGLARAMVETEYRGFIAVEYEAHFLAKGYPKDPIGAARQSKAFLDEVFSEWLSSRAS